MESCEDNLTKAFLSEMPGQEIARKIHIGRYMGGLGLFIAGLDEFVSPSGAVWAGGRTMIIEGYKRVKHQNE